MYCYRAFRNHDGQGQAPQRDQQGDLGMKRAEIEQFTLYDTSIESACGGHQLLASVKAAMHTILNFKYVVPAWYTAAPIGRVVTSAGVTSHGAPYVRQAPKQQWDPTQPTRGSLHVVDATAESSATSTS